MVAWRMTAVFVAILLSGLACIAQEKAPARLILRVDETTQGPFGGQKSSSCLRIYSDGRVLYASWWNSAATLVDETTGKPIRPEHTLSVEHHLDDTDAWALGSFLDSRVVQRLPEKFGPPHRAIDYFEDDAVEIIDSRGRSKKIWTREYYVASLEEKSKYPSALIVLMGKIDEIEKEAESKGKPFAVPADCSLEKAH